MKSLKKYFKVILCFMAFAVASFLFAFAPSFGSYAALNTAKEGYNMAVKAVKMPRSVYVDDNGQKSLRIPLLTGTWQDSAKYTVRVVDVTGNSIEHDYVVGAAAGHETSEEDANYFNKIEVDGQEYLSITSLNEGTYKILYILEENGHKYYSPATTVTVDSVEYGYDYSIQTDGENKGLKHLIPETVKQSSQDSAKIELPVAHIMDKKSKTILEGVTANIKIFNDFGTILNASSELVEVVDGVTYFKPKTIGKYTIEYSYNFGKTDPQQFTIEVKSESDFTAPTSEELTIEIPKIDSVELGQKNITLPEVTVNSKNKSKIQHNIKSIVISKGNISKELNNNNRTFDMTKEFFNQDNYSSAMLGDWDVKYTIVDAYGNEKSIKVKLDNVKDSTNPEVFMAYDYNTEDANAMKALNENASKISSTIATEFKSQLGYNELYFPAIYAKDSVTSYEDFIFVRYIAKTNTDTSKNENRYYIDNVMLKDDERHLITADETSYTKNLNKNLIVDGTVNAGDANKAVKFNFNVEDPSTMAGEYVLGYEVYTKAKNGLTKQTGVYKIDNTLLKFTILSTDVAETTTNVEHKVEITNLADAQSIESNGSLTVNINASETKRTTTAGESTEKVDKRLKNAVFYYYKANGAGDLKQDLTDAFNAAKNARQTQGLHYGTEHIFESAAFKNAMIGKYEKFTYATEKDKNNYKLTLEGYDPAYGNNVYIVAISLDDDANIAYTVKTLNIKNVGNADAPVAKCEDAHSLDSATDHNLANKVFKRGDTIKLPDVSFADDDKSLQLSVYYYMEGENGPVGVKGYKYSTPMNKLMRNNVSVDGTLKSMIYGGEIHADKDGTYHVVYSATDDAGNTTFMYFTYTVATQAKPSFNVTFTGDYTSVSGVLISGETGMEIKFNPVLKKNDGTLINTGVTVEPIITDNGNEYKLGGDDFSYIFNGQGSFKIKFVATYNDGSETSTFESDTFTIKTTYPEFKWNDSNFDSSNYAYAPKNSTVTLPFLTASRGKESADEITVSVKFKGDKVDVVKNATSTAWEFVTGNVAGDYEVVYTATIQGSSPITKSFKIKVGDNVAPRISISHESDLKQDLIYDGSTNIEYTVRFIPTNSASGSRTRKLEIIITNGDNKTTYDLALDVKDRNEMGQDVDLSWNNVKVELKNGNSTMSSTTPETYMNTYTISATGVYKLVIKATDDNNNTETKEIEFNVKSETKVEKDKDTVVGVVLIVLSLVILAGVILFFAFTGKGKGGANKAKATKQPKSKDVKAEKVETEEVKSEEAEKVEETTETVEENNDEQPKSGDVE